MIRGEINPRGGKRRKRKEAKDKKRGREEGSNSSGEQITKLVQKVKNDKT